MAFYDNMEQVLDFNNIEDLDVSEHYDSPSIYDDSCLCIPQDSLHEVFETFPSITSNKPISWRDLGIDLDFKDVSFGETFLNFEPKLSHEFEFNIGTYKAEDQEGEEEAKIVTLKGIENYENNLIEPDVSQESEFNIGTHEVEDQEGEEEGKMVTLKGVENYENKLTEPAFFEPKLSQEFESNIGTYEAEDQEGEEEAKMVTLKGIENYENKLIEPAFFEPKLSQEFESNIGTYEAEDQEGEEEVKMVTLKGTKNYENKLIEPAFFKPKLSQEFESNIGTNEAEDQEGEEEAKMVTLKGIKNYQNKLIEPAFFEPKLSQEFESNIGTRKAEDQEGEEAKRVTLKALENYENKLIEPFFSGFIKKKPRTKRCWQKYTKVLFGNHKMPKKCTHCRAERTPQWRAGPLGPKTLCNACGVRFKLGKLLPEYRPAASPEFDGKKYSNFHKRIMKRKAIEINNSCSAREVNNKKVLYDKYGIAMGKPDFYNKYFVH